MKNIDPHEDMTICGYPVRDLVLFAEACKRQHVTKDDLKRVAEDITWAVETVYKANEDAAKNIMYEMTENGCSAVMRVELPPPINPKRLGRMEWKFDGAKRVKMPEIKTMDIKEWKKDGDAE